MNRYYLAYGSNLNLPQMRMRCPRATIVGTAEIEDYELLFRGSMTGSYLTIGEKKGGKVPVAVWKVTPSDEEALDRYEGFPRFYYKEDIRIEYTGTRSKKKHSVDAFAYIMHEDRPFGIPSNYYMEICMEGYRIFGFDDRLLFDAVERSRKEAL